MLTIARSHTFALLFVSLSSCAYAGGPVQSLPADGSWVKFLMEHEVSGPDGISASHTGSWTVRSVGTKIVNGEKCRWIEIEEHIEEADDGEPLTRWFKYLIPEKDLKRGANPWSNLVEFWHRDTHQTKTPTRSDQRRALMSMFLRGTPKAKKAVAKSKRVLWQRGEFVIKQAEEQTQTIHAKDASYSLAIRDVVWKKDDVPFGTAAVNSSVRLDRDEFPSYTYVRRLWLRDHGTNAESRIPQAK